MSVGDDAVGLELLDEDPDDIALHKTTRRAGSMSAMSGAKGMIYMEYKYGYLAFFLDSLFLDLLLDPWFMAFSCLLFIPIPFVLFIVAEETSNMVRKKPNLRIQPRDTIYLGNASSNHITEPH